MGECWQKWHSGCAHTQRDKEAGRTVVRRKAHVVKTPPKAKRVTRKPRKTTVEDSEEEGEDSAEEVFCEEADPDEEDLGGADIMRQLAFARE